MHAVKQLLTCRMLESCDEFQKSVRFNYDVSNHCGI